MEPEVVNAIVMVLIGVLFGVVLALLAVAWKRITELTEVVDGLVKSNKVIIDNGLTASMITKELAGRVTRLENERK